MTETLGNVSRPSLGREILLRLITFTLPFIFLLLVEGVLRLAGAGENLDLFVENPAEGYSGTMIVNPVVGKKYFQKFEYTSPPNDIFLKKKEAGSFRIFVLGSSTVVGFPHEYNLMFSRILHKQLEDAFPGRKIEMVNTAITAINSHTLYDYARQIVHQEPDAILVYAGHNEFYGAFGTGSRESVSKSPALTRLNFFFMNFRFFQVLKNAAGRMTLRRQEEVHGTLMKRMVGNPDIPLDSQTYKQAMKHYRQNMEDILALFSKKGIPVFLSEVVSNVKDMPPFSSVVSKDDNEAWQSWVSGREALAEGKEDRALELLEMARDRDGIRFRASGEVNGIIRELASGEGVYLVPMLEQFKSRSPGGIVGAELMTEHVHPNVNGEFLMADAFRKEIFGSGLMGDPTAGIIYPLSYYRTNWGMSILDSLLAHHRVANLATHWPFQPADRPLPDYRLSYRPRYLEDSLAFTAMKEPGLRLDELRLELARSYEKAGKTEKAYREYEALLRTNPYLAVNYRDAASSLILLGDLPLALQYYQKSLEFEASFFASYRMGEIYLIKGDYASSRKAFQQAFEWTADQEERLKTMGKLYQACAYAGEREDARVIAEQLKQYQAENYLRIPPPSYTYTSYIPFQTREQVEKARSMMVTGQFDEAIAILGKSLLSYDSHMARRYLGECYLQKGDDEKARMHLDMVKDEFAFDKGFPGYQINP